MAEKWIQGAHLKEGSFTAQAKKAGMSVQEFANHVLANKDDFDSKTVRRAQLAKTFKKMATAEGGITVIDGVIARDLLDHYFSTDFDGAFD